jgi:hypothetical protein
MSPSSLFVTGAHRIFRQPGYELAIKSLLAAARLVSRDEKDGFASRVEREGYVQTPSAALKRNSFIFAWREH